MFTSFLVIFDLRIGVYSKTANNRRGGLITSRGVLLVVLVLVFVVPGAVLVVIDVVAGHYGY